MEREIFLKPFEPHFPGSGPPFEWKILEREDAIATWKTLRPAREATSISSTVGERQYAFSSLVAQLLEPCHELCPFTLCLIVAVAPATRDHACRSVRAITFSMGSVIEDFLLHKHIQSPFVFHFFPHALSKFHWNTLQHSVENKSRQR